MGFDDGVATSNYPLRQESFVHLVFKREDTGYRQRISMACRRETEEEDTTVLIQSNQIYMNDNVCLTYNTNLEEEAKRYMLDKCMFGCCMISLYHKVLYGMNLTTKYCAPCVSFKALFRLFATSILLACCCLLVKSDGCYCNYNRQNMGNLHLFVLDDLLI